MGHRQHEALRPPPVPGPAGVIEVTLSWFEVNMAAQQGIIRHVQALKAGRQDAHGFNGDGWGAHIDGALGELALAKALDAYWNPVLSYQARQVGDVGAHQVRMTARPDGSLIVHEDDRDDADYWLVVGTAPRYLVIGSRLGLRCKEPRFWREDTGRPAYFVPQAELTPA